MGAIGIVEIILLSFVYQNEYFIVNDLVKASALLRCTPATQTSLSEGPNFAEARSISGRLLIIFAMVVTCFSYNDQKIVYKSDVFNRYQNFDFEVTVNIFHSINQIPQNGVENRSFWP